MIGIPLGLLAANATEWLVHKHMLHGLGRNKKSFWSFHWHVHHKVARKSAHVDPDYTRPWWSESPRRREVASLVGAAVAVAPLFPVAPFFTLTAWYCTGNYYAKHKKSHLDIDWAKAHMPWHYDHHMGPDQNMNWCVTRPWFDDLLGTRQRYVGTEREVADVEKRARLNARRAAAAAAAA